MTDVVIVLGSITDKEYGVKVAEVLRRFGLEARITVASAHRSPERVRRIVEKAESDEVQVFIAVAGLSALLPSLIAAYTVKPVISLPLSRSLLGLDALLSSIQTPPGVPVACVGIDNATNAALLAAEILALSKPNVRSKLIEYRVSLKRKVEEDSATLESNLEVGGG